MKSLADTIKLSNGTSIPCVGFGTWQSPDGEVATHAVVEAINAGYRHIDAAAIYGNEISVGEGIVQSGINRKDLFVTSKVWNSQRGFDRAIKAYEQTCTDLGLAYLDLYLIHWPAAIGTTKEWEKVNADTWRGLEKLYTDGRVKAIGVSNFLVHYLVALMQTAQIAPMVNQIEFHPGFMQAETVEYCNQHNILVEAWSPLGTGKMLRNPTLQTIAQKYNKSVAQLCIRWCLQNNTVPLPKSVTPARIIENAQVFDFEISSDDMAQINAMPYFGGSGLNPDEIHF
jgi:diketogulonate reductase-like aldo/keto reductase